jgi:hypothetical protein
LDRVDPEIVKPNKSFDGGPEADIYFQERYKRGKMENGVAGKMMGLELIKIKNKHRKKSEASKPNPRTK